jgi:hypothetical protein
MRQARLPSAEDLIYLLNMLQGRLPDYQIRDQLGQIRKRTRKLKLPMVSPEQDHVADASTQRTRAAPTNDAPSDWDDETDAEDWAYLDIHALQETNAAKSKIVVKRDYNRMSTKLVGARYGLLSEKSGPGPVKGIFGCQM